MMRFGPRRTKVSREEALSNPRTVAVYDAVRVLGEASAQQVLTAMQSRIRTSVSEVAEKLAHLKLAGLLRVRRVDLAPDPHIYNLYSVVI